MSQTITLTAVQNVIGTNTESNSQAALEIGRDAPASQIRHKGQQSPATQMAKRKEGCVFQSQETHSLFSHISSFGLGYLSETLLASFSP